MTELNYPITVPSKGAEFVVRKIASEDASQIQQLTLRLPQQDLLYINRDLTKLPVIEAWIKSAVTGDFETLVVEQDGNLVATSALAIDKRSWSSHVGEIRVLVDVSVRKNGIGRFLIERMFMHALEAGLMKIIAQMTVDQRGAIAVFEELGFIGEALLKDHVMDTECDLHDLLILSCDVERAAGNLMLAS